jgi:metallophosphoesterase (TIGR00282 family)
MIDRPLRQRNKTNHPGKLEKGCKDIYSGSMGIRVLFLGEIVGRAGIHAVKTALKPLRESCRADFVVANAEGATNGFGLGRNHALQLQKLGIDLLTTGEKTYYKLDMVEHIGKNSRIIRPANYPVGNPGRPFKTVQIGENKAIFTVLLGTSDFPKTHLANPYQAIQSMLERFKEETPIIFLQFHASTTAEKQTMAFLLDGKATAMIGTHSKVLTADSRILPHGTAMISDNGRCGSTLSVGGFDPATELQRYVSQVPSRSRECWQGIELQGVVVEADGSGKAVSIETVRLAVDTPTEFTASEE